MQPQKSFKKYYIVGLLTLVVFCGILQILSRKQFPKSLLSAQVSGYSKRAKYSFHPLQFFNPFCRWSTSISLHREYITTGKRSMKFFHKNLLTWNRYRTWVLNWKSTPVTSSFSESNADISSRTVALRNREQSNYCSAGGLPILCYFQPHSSGLSLRTCRERSVKSSLRHRCWSRYWCFGPQAKLVINGWGVCGWVPSIARWCRLNGTMRSGSRTARRRSTHGCARYILDEADELNLANSSLPSIAATVISGDFPAPPLYFPRPPPPPPKSTFASTSGRGDLGSCRLALPLARTRAPSYPHFMHTPRLRRWPSSAAARSAAEPDQVHTQPDEPGPFLRRQIRSHRPAVRRRRLW